MTATVFVDTNVLVYARDRADADKHRRALAWMAALWDRKAGRLSYQVLNEYYVTVTRKLVPTMSSHDARDDVASLVTWRPLPVDLLVLDRAWGIEDRYGFSWWDSLILAAAQVSECDYLISEDLQDGQQIGSVQVMSPFTTEPADIMRAGSGGLE